MVKTALTYASDPTSPFNPLLQSCHGVGFFATPHRGSKFLASENYKVSLQRLLRLARPLPSTLRRQLIPESPALLKINENFKDIVSEMRVWSFYEASDSRLLEKTVSGAKEVQITTPAVIATMRSSLLGLRQEKVYGLQATHASCAGFGGRKNAETARLFLEDLASAVQAAHELSRNQMVEVLHGNAGDDVRGTSLHASLQLEKQGGLVKIHGFYEHSSLLAVEAGAGLRVFVTKRSLMDFCRTASEQLLQERLEVEDRELEMLTRATSLTPSGAVTQGTPHSIGKHVSADERRASTNSGFAKNQPRPLSLTTPPRIEVLAPIVDGDIDTSDLEASTAPGYAPKTSSHTQPSEETPNFVWIHVPANNPAWVRKVFEALSVHQERDFSELLNEEHWKSRHARGRHSQHHACFLKSTCGFTSLKPKLAPNSPGSAKTVPNHGERRTSTGSLPQVPSVDCLYLFFPFLHFDSYKMLIRRRDMIQRRMRQGRTSPVPRDVQENSSLELRMIWQFLGHDPPVNCRRTLDQYRYPSLRDTRARDDDQMLYKMTKQSVYRAAERRNAPCDLKNGISWMGRPLSPLPEENYEDEGACADSDGACSERDLGREPDLDDGKDVQDVLDGNVLMVDQLWLWAIDSSEHTLRLPCFDLSWKPRINRSHRDSPYLLSYQRRESYGRASVPASGSPR